MRKSGSDGSLARRKLNDVNTPAPTIDFQGLEYLLESDYRPTVYLISLCLKTGKQSAQSDILWQDACHSLHSLL